MEKEGSQPSAQLEKSLGYKSILLIAISSIMGTGIFFLPALGASYSGPASLIAWLIMSGIAIYAAMCFAELTSMYPTSGGIYEFAKNAYGRTMSFFIGWMTIIAGYVTIAMVMIGAITYIIPTGVSAQYTVFFALVFILLFNAIAYRGLQTSVTMLIIFALISLSTIAILVIPGLFYFDMGQLQPFFIEPGFFPIAFTVFIIASTFFGWETTTFLAGETKNGERVVPRAIVHATIIIAILSFLVTISAFFVIPASVFALSGAPMTQLGMEIYGSQSFLFFSIVVYLALIGTVAGWIVSAPRLILSLAQDGLFLKHLSYISPKYKTPSKAIFFQTIIISFFVIIGAGSFEVLLQLLMPLALIIYAFVVASVLILRMTQPQQERHFRVPFAPLGIPILIVIFVSMIGTWILFEENALGTLYLGLGLIAIGIPLYFLIELYNNKNAATKAKDILAYYTYMFENFFIPKHIQEEIITYLGNIKGKTVLEYGASVGTLTQHLIYLVGKDGIVIAINNSKVELKILSRRVKEPEWKSFDRIRGELRLLHHHEYHDDVHETILQAHALVSIDTLSGMEDPKKILKKLAEIMPEHSKVCFFDFINFFSIIPDQPWLHSDAAIEKLFSECGFQVRVRRVSGVFWKYIFIYGLRSDRKIVMM